MGPKTRHLPKQTEVKKNKLKDRSWLIATQQKALHVNTYEQQKKLKWISKRLNSKIDTVGGMCLPNTHRENSKKFSRTMYHFERNTTTNQNG